MLSRAIRAIPTDHLLYGAWAVTLTATLGSWALSEIWHLQPCILCWLQRIAMYPLAIILPIGILRRDPELPYYVLPLSLIGLGLSGYHSLLQWGIIPETIAPCTQGVSCVTKQINFLGFITIPFLSFLAFLTIVALMGLALRRHHSFGIIQKS